MADKVSGLISAFIYLGVIHSPKTAAHALIDIGTHLSNGKIK